MTGRDEGSEMTSKRTYEDNAKFGKKGGKETKTRHGEDHFKKIGQAGGRKGGKTLKESTDPEHFSEIGGKGGRVTLERHGSDYFRQLALKRHQKNKAEAGDNEK